MVADAILDCSARGDLVLDPFSAVVPRSSQPNAQADAVTASKSILSMSILLFAAGRLSAVTKLAMRSRTRFQRNRAERGERHVDDRDDDGIGYGKPPRALGFKGTSGNPRGRRKGSGIWRPS